MKLNISLKLKGINYSNSSREILDLLIEATYLATIFLVPLWFAYLFPTYHIFEFNKFAIFKILTWLLFFFTGLKLIFYGDFKSVLKKLVRRYWIYPTLFIGGLCLLFPLSTNPIISFYGTMERQTGLIFYLFCFFWFILTSFNLLTVNNYSIGRIDSLEKRVIRILMTVSVSATLVSVYGILQRLNIDFLIWPEPAYLTNRVFSTFGQPNFLASWLLLAIPVGVWLVFQMKTFLLRSWFVLAVVLQFICLILTGSRGGIIAFFLVSFLFLLYFLGKNFSSRSRKILMTLISAILFIISFWLINIVLSGRVSAMLDYKSGSIGARFSLYSVAIEAINEKPLFGYGLETGRDVLIQFYNTDWAVFNNVGQLADKAHNLILDIALSLGFCGLFVFSLFYYYFFYLVKKNIYEDKHKSLSLCLFFGAAAYLTSLLFSFSTIAGDIYFWLFLALLVVINFSHKENNINFYFYDLIKSGLNIFRKIFNLKKVRKSVSIVMTCALIGLVYWQILNVFRSIIADYYFNNINFLLLKPDYFTSLVIDGYFNEQKVNIADQMAYEAYLGERLSDFYPTNKELAARKVVRERLDRTEEILPNKGYFNLLVKAKINNALQRYASAQDYLSALIDLAPHWPIAYLEQGRVFLNQGDSKQAIIAYNMALLNLPLVEDSRLNDPHRKSVEYYRYLIFKEMADIYEKDGKYSAAENYYKLAYQNNYDDFGLLKKIADTCYLRGDFEKAIAYIKQGIRRSPEDYKWYLLLGVLYSESGNKEVGVQFLEKALQFNQNNQEVINILLKYKK